MSSVKAQMGRSIEQRRKAALAVLKPQWRACKRTRPLGHIRDGSRNHKFEMVCVYCGAPEYVRRNDVISLESAATEAHGYPIARAMPKESVVA